MLYRPLGKSSIHVSELGFGCMSLGDETEQNITLIHQALDLGINFFDTADLYAKGRNEVTLGKALKARRKEAIVATKVGNQWKSDGSGWEWNPRKAYILQAVDQSLLRLDTDYIDLYQLHGGTIDDPIDETIEALEMLQAQGKIRHYGISSIRPNVIRAYVDKSNIISVMMQYSLLDRRPEETCLSLLKTHGISVLARGSLGQGLLVDKQPIPYLNRSAEEVDRLASALRNVAPEARQRAALSIQFVLRDPTVSSAVVGIRTVGQLEGLVQSMNGPGPLLAEQLQKLALTLAPNFYELYR
jgi:aryl-alcohol dehydrogenase-like predicted oxidoreductase